jgi:hypothetical protein
MVGSETSSVVANVLVSGVESIGVISASVELDKDCIGSTSSEAVGSGSSVIGVDVVSPGIWGNDSASDWVVVICASPEIVLVETSSSDELVGINSLEATSMEVGAEETSVLRKAAIVVLSGSEALIDTSKDREALGDISTDKEGTIEVESGTSFPIAVVGSLVNAGTKLSPPTMADRLSAAIPVALLSLPRTVELAAVSTAGIDSVPVSRAIDGKVSEIESTSLSCGWGTTVSVGVSSSEVPEEVATIVVSGIVLSALVVKSELMVTSTAVGEGEIIRDELIMSSPDERVLAAGDDKVIDENDNVGISESTLVIIAPTFIPADIISVWLIVESASTETLAEISRIVVAAVLSVVLEILMLEMAWEGEPIKGSSVAVGTMSEMTKVSAEIVDERGSGVVGSDVANDAEATGSLSSGDSDEVLPGFNATLTRLETLGSAEIEMVVDTDSITPVAGSDDSLFKAVVWGVEVIWTELSIVFVGSVSGINTSPEFTMSLTEAMMLGTSVMATDVEVESDTTKEVGCVL